MTLHLARPARARTGRIGVLLSPDGDRAFVADRGAADQLRPSDLRPGWLAGAALLHLPAYSLFTRPLGDAARRAVQLARNERAHVSLDLASSGPLLAAGPEAALELVRIVAPDLLFATLDEAVALLGDGGGDAAASTMEARASSGKAATADALPAAALEALAALSPVVVVKRGSAGATVLLRGAPGPPRRLDVAVRPLDAVDTTGAGDAFDAGFIVAWLAAGGPTGRVETQPNARPSEREVLRRATQLRRAVLAGHRAARRELTARRPQLPLL